MPVATLIIFFPIFILLMWLLEKSYIAEPEKKHLSVRRWLTYITLFIAGLTLAGDLVTVLYYFIDGQELTTGFLLKVLAVLVVILGVFIYYISDIREKLTPKSRKTWVALSVVFILACITWGFLILGSPHTQQLMKYDQQKVSDLQNISNEVQNYYQLKNSLPNTLADLSAPNYYVVQNDGQTGKLYEYNKTGNLTYEVCAEFNKTSNEKSSYPTIQIQMYPNNGGTWAHPIGRYCFPQTITPSNYPPKAIPVQ